MKKKTVNKIIPGTLRKKHINIVHRFIGILKLKYDPIKLQTNNNTKAIIKDLKNHFNIFINSPN